MHKSNPCKREEAWPEMSEESTARIDGSEFIGDSKPVVLHVLHSWGGGIDFFARDLQAGDKQRVHFFLKSHSRDNLPPFGKELCLYKDLDDQPLATWHLSAPVMDTDLHSDEIAAILYSIIEKWTVGAVIVSSLIGHSLDVLRTGLPTALAVHDVYPFWPLLHDANTDDYSVDYLRQALIDSKTMNIFLPHEAEYWLAIRDELVSLILDNQIACVAPSIFSRQRVCRIDSRLNDARWSILPHGVAPLARTAEPDTTKKIGNLKVLVPGHINGGKGEVLLNELIPSLPDGVELVLLGSAHLSDQFASEKVTTIDHYRREELADIVSQIKPDLALLASTVPETYGYVLSEMLQLGIPVVCSDIGAYAERGQYLPGVMLVKPEKAAFLEMLVQFRDHPEQLARQKHDLPYSFPDLREMANAWATHLPANPPQWLYEFIDDPSIEVEVTMNLQLNHLSEILKAVHATTEKNTQVSHEALDSINRQQASIEEMLAGISAQSRHIANLLETQNAIEVALQNKAEEIERLKIEAGEQAHGFQEQLRLAAAREAGLQTNIDMIGSRLDLLSQDLAAMQAKRGWRFLSFFR